MESSINPDWDKLPIEKLLDIFSYLTPEAMASLRLVNKRFRDKIDALWKDKFNLQFSHRKIQDNDDTDWYQEFKNAYEDEYQGLTSEQKKLFSKAKEKQITLDDLKNLTFPECALLMDANGISLLRWIKKTDNQSFLDKLFDNRFDPRKMPTSVSTEIYELHCAILTFQPVESIQRLITQNTKLDLPISPYSHSAVTWAIITHQHGLANSLIVSGAKPERKPAASIFLQTAVRTGDIERVEKWLEKDEIFTTVISNAGTLDGLVWDAANSGKVRMANWLISVKNAKAEMALLGALSGGQVSVIEMLLDEKKVTRENIIDNIFTRNRFQHIHDNILNRFVKDNDFKAALLKEIQNGRIDFASRLSPQEFDFGNATYTYEQENSLTLLHIAIMRFDIRLENHKFNTNNIKSLLEKGVNPLAKTGSGLNALELAAKLGYGHIVKILLEIKQIEWGPSAFRALKYLESKNPDTHAIALQNNAIRPSDYKANTEAIADAISLLRPFDSLSTNLESYLQQRQNDQAPKYKTFFGFLGGEAYSQKTKCAAAEKLMKAVNGEEINSFTRLEIAALQQGELGNIVLNNKASWPAMVTECVEKDGKKIKTTKSFEEIYNNSLIEQSVRFRI